MRALRNIIAGSRYMLIIAVFGTFVASLAVLLYAGIAVVLLMIGFFAQFKFQIEDIKHVAITSIELIDLFLISTVLYIFSLALYSLFIDNKLPLPRWLEITNLDDLERRLLGVIVVLLTITFLGSAVDWSFGDYSIVALGIAIGVVLFSIGYLLSRGGLVHNGARTSGTNGETNAESSIEQNT
jgi:uncharacterized membrane protein YqhA